MTYFELVQVLAVDSTVGALMDRAYLVFLT